MKMLRHAILGGALLLTTASAGFAQTASASWLPFNSFYVRGDIGGAFGTDTTFKNLPDNYFPGAGSTQPSSLGELIHVCGGGITACASILDVP